MLLSPRKVAVLLVAMLVVLALSIKLGAVGSASSKKDTGPSPTEDAQALTPIVGDVSNAPIPFEGSDGRTHIVYELEVTNFSNGKTTIRRLKVLDADTNEAVATLDAKEVAARLQPAGFREPVDTLASSTTALVFLHVSFEKVNQVPDRLIHRLSVDQPVNRRSPRSWHRPRSSTAKSSWSDPR